MLETIAEILRATIAVGLVTTGILAILIWVKNLTIKLSILRLFVQIIASIAIFVILLFWPLPWDPILSGLVFFAFTAGSFMVRMLWCRFCPVGATLSILNSFSPFKCGSHPAHRQSRREVYKMWHMQKSLPRAGHRGIRRKGRQRNGTEMYTLLPLRRDVSIRGLPKHKNG